MRSSSPSPRRAYWLRTLHQWHWVSAAISLTGMILFSITGITLNNAAWIESSATTTRRQLTLPPELLQDIPENTDNSAVHMALPLALERHLNQFLGIRIDGRQAEISSDEIYLSLPQPGADAWLAIERDTGALEYEKRSRGWIAYFNDLHKGRHAGRAWSWFLDLFAISCLIFSISGLLLMKTHAANRPSTWPLLGFGALAPLLLMLLFIH